MGPVREDQPRSTVTEVLQEAGVLWSALAPVSPATGKTKGEGLVPWGLEGALGAPHGDVPGPPARVWPFSSKLLAPPDRGPPSSPSDDKGPAWEQLQTHWLWHLPPLSQAVLPRPLSSPGGGSGFPRGGERLPRSHGLCCRCPVTGAWGLGSVSRDRAP